MKRKKLLKKIGISSALIGILGTTGGQLSSVIVAKASTISESTVLTRDGVINLADYDLSPLNGLITKGVLNEFSFNNQEELVLNLTKEELLSKYNLNDEEEELFNQIVSNIEYLNEINSSGISNELTFDHQRITVKNWKIYFNHGETVSLLASAAAAGPAALYAAFVGISSMVGGPIGTILSILGGISLIQAGNYIAKACATGKGYYIGLDTSGFIPSITQGIW